MGVVSTAAEHTVAWPPPGGPLTRAVLDSMPEDGRRYELIDGSLIVSPAPRIAHQRAVMALVAGLLEKVPPGSELLTAPVDVVLADDTVMQPDILLARTGDFTQRDLPAAPTLAIEVLSPSTRSLDLLLKRERLEQAGCPHYWVVDPDAPSITAWSLGEDGLYGDAVVAVGDEPYETTAPFAVTIVPSALTGD